MSATSRARKAAAALAVGALALVMPLGGTAAWADDESPSPTPATTSESSTDATPLEKVNALVQPSVVFLLQTWSGYVYDTFNKQYLNNGNPFELQFQCTGFVVSPDGYIATAGHCVDFKEVQGSFIQTGAQWALDNAYYSSTTLTLDDVLGFGDYRVESAEKRNAADLDVQVGWGASVSGIDSSEVHRARVIDFDGQAKGDVALLKVEETDLNALPISTEEVEVGAAVVSIGFPASVDQVTDPNLTPSFKDGSISSVKTVQGGVLPVYEISAAVSGGMSGGPSVNLDGEVIGVNSFGILGEPQAFNFLRPSSQLAELMASAGVTAELSETTQAYRDGLQAYWAGEKAEAVELLTEVVDEQPANELAANFLEEAEDLPDPEPVAEASDSDEDSGGGLPIVPIIIGIVVLGLIGGVVAFLLLRRKGTGPAAPVAAAPVPVAPGGAPYSPQPVVSNQSPVPDMASAPLGFTGTPAPPAPAAPPAAPPTVAMPVASAAAPPPAPAAPVESAAAPTPAPVEAAAPPPAPAAPVVDPPAAPAAPESHFCSDCGTPAEAGKKFCSNCGSKLT